MKNIVFLHYFGGSAHTWNWVTDLLEPNYNCIALNFPGFGGTDPLSDPSIQTMADHTREAIKALNLTDFILVAHSMGAKIALQIAADSTEGTIEHLVLVAPSPSTEEVVKPEEKARMLEQPDVAQAKETLRKVTLIPLDAEQYALALENHLVADHQTWAWWIEEGMSHSIASVAKSLTLPITIIASKDDPAISYESLLKDRAEVLTHAELVTTQGVGHLMPFEACEWLAETIKTIVA